MNKKFIPNMMIFSAFIENFFVSVGYPSFYKNTIMVVDERLLALSTILSCSCSIIISKMWNKWSDKMFSKYIFFNVLEGICNIGVVIFGLITNDLHSYYIIDMLIASFLSYHLFCARTKIKSMYLIGNIRERFDNNCSIAINTSVIVGSSLSFILGDMININMSLVLMLVSLIISNIVDLIIYYFIKRGDINNE